MKIVDPYDDPWQDVGKADPASSAASPPPWATEPFRILSLTQWQETAAHVPAGQPTGVRVPNDIDIETFAGVLARATLVALHFPAWTDGRAYTQARLLRSRYAYAGEIRATGEVLADMMPLLQRSGFDSAALRADQSAAVARRALGFFPAGYYQGRTLHAR